MLVPQYFWKRQQYLIGCLSRFRVSSQTPPSLWSLLWLMLGNHVTYCPTWGLLRAKGVLLITMLNNRHRPGLSQKNTVSSALDRVGCVLPSTPKAPLSVHHTSCVCMLIPTLAWELHKDEGQAFFFICISSISPAPGTEMTQSVINKGKCLFSKLSG